MLDRFRGLEPSRGMHVRVGRPGVEHAHANAHRTHMRIFNGSYYPPELSDWYMDDWISRVYGRRRTTKHAELGEWIVEPGEWKKLRDGDDFKEKRKADSK